MGFCLCTSECYGCKRPFSYNPRYVPSLTINGTKEPFCLNCINAANIVRKEKGIAPLVPHPQAYEPLPEEEL
jgi:hypothetical protein